MTPSAFARDYCLPSFARSYDKKPHSCRSVADAISGSPRTCCCGSPTPNDLASNRRAPYSCRFLCCCWWLAAPPPETNVQTRWSSPVGLASSVFTQRSSLAVRGFGAKKCGYFRVLIAEAFAEQPRVLCNIRRGRCKGNWNGVHVVWSARLAITLRREFLPTSFTKGVVLLYFLGCCLELYH